MHLLIRNLNLELCGPGLLFYYGVALGLMVAAAAWVARRDSAMGLPAIPAPEQPDPYEIAYLRGGEPGVIRVVVMDLIQRDYLTVISDAAQRQPLYGVKRGPLNAAHLSPLQLEVFASLATPMTMEELEQSSLPVRFRVPCRRFDKTLRAQALLRSQRENRNAVRATVFASVALSILGSIVVRHSLTHGEALTHTSAFLMLAALAAVVIVCQPGRLTGRGRRYLRLLHRQLAHYAQTACASEVVLLQTALTGVTAPANGINRLGKRLNLSVTS